MNIITIGDISLFAEKISGIEIRGNKIIFRLDNKDSMNCIFEDAAHARKRLISIIEELRGFKDSHS